MGRRAAARKGQQQSAVVDLTTQTKSEEDVRMDVDARKHPADQLQALQEEQNEEFHSPAPTHTSTRSGRCGASQQQQQQQGAAPLRSTPKPHSARAATRLRQREGLFEDDAPDVAQQPLPQGGAAHDAATLLGAFTPSNEPCGPGAEDDDVSAEQEACSEQQQQEDMELGEAGEEEWEDVDDGGAAVLEDAEEDAAAEEEPAAARQEEPEDRQPGPQGGEEGAAAGPHEEGPDAEPAQERDGGEGQEDMQAEGPEEDQPMALADAGDPQPPGVPLLVLPDASAGAAAEEQRGGAAQAPPVPPPAGDAQWAVSRLTHRLAARRGSAALGVPVRPALARLQEQLQAALEGVVVNGTSASVLVLGDPGSGKTLLVERAVAVVCSVHNGEAWETATRPEERQGRRVGVVRLSGLLHMEERPAFQEMARQLCSEFGEVFSKSATFDENLGFLRNMLARLQHDGKAVVFVLDGFERFARARGKQQLLYNLFDVLQHSHVQAAVIGVTCAQDVMESMEKRVRSRFSHQRMMLTALTHFEVPAVGRGVATAAAAAAGRAAAQGGKPAAGGPAGAEDPEQAPPVTFADTPAGVLRDMLALPAPAPGPASGGSGSAALQQAQPAAEGCSAAFVRRFNESVEASVRDVAVQAELRRLFVMGLKPRTLATAARVALDAWEEACLQQQQAGAGAGELPAVPVTPAHLLVGLRPQLPASQAPRVADLSVLQLMLVAGMVRLEKHKRLAAYNFEMVWDECSACRPNSETDGRAMVTREAGWRAFEELVALNVAYWSSANAEGSGKDMRYAGATLAVSEADVRRGFETARGGLPTYVQRFLNEEAPL